MLAFSSPLQRRPDSDLTLLVVNPGVISYHDVAKKLGSKVEHVFDAFPGAGGGVGLSGHSTSLDVILPVVKPGGGGQPASHFGPNSANEFPPRSDTII
jgi:hypothetical protein